MLFIFLGDIGSKILGFFATTYLARTLGTGGFGMLNIALAALSYALLLATNGLPLLGTQKIAALKRPDPSLVGNIISTRFMLSILAFALLALVAFIGLDSGKSDEYRLILIYGLFLFPSALLLDWFFQAKHQMGVISAGRFAQMIAYLVFILCFVRNLSDIQMTAWAWVIGGCVNAALLGWIFLNRGNHIAFELTSAKILQLWKAAFPLGLASAISQIVLQFPVLYLAWFASHTDVGIFSAAFRMMTLLLIFDRIFYTVFFPAISRCAGQTPERLEEITNRVLKLVAISALTIGLVAIFSASWLIPLIFSAQYVEAIPLFQLLSGVFIFTMINSVIGFTLIGMGHHKEFTRSVFWGFIAFMIAIFILPPLFGLNGVVSALVIYQFVALMMVTVFLRRHLVFQWVRNAAFPVLMATFVLLPVLWRLNLTPVVNFLTIILACLPLIALAAGFRNQDWQFIKRTLI